MGTAGTLGGWALQGCFVLGHCRDALRLGTAVRLRAEDNIDFIISQPHCKGGEQCPRAGKAWQVRS